MADMTVKRLNDLIAENTDSEYLSWQGVCHDCAKEMEVRAVPEPDGIHVQGGGVFEPEPNRFFLKCDDCYRQDPILRNFRECEVYSRVVGYLRPVAQWNDAKQREFGDRKLFKPSAG